MKPTESVMTDEEFVRASWESAKVEEDRTCWGDSWRAVLGPQYMCAKSPSEAWSAAAEFTSQRKEEIRLVEEEIEFLDALDEGDEVVARLLAREQSVLDELKRGMK